MLCAGHGNVAVYDEREEINVLVVDDHELMRQMMGQVLTRDQHIKVAGTAGDGHEAIELITRCKEKFDVLVMDFALPGLNGVEVIRALRELSIRIPVIIVSVHEQLPLVVEAVKEGAQAFLAKKNITRELIPAVYAAYSKRRRHTRK
jgi:DNA-binding NarL/FixJ family response regulator